MKKISIICVCIIALAVFAVWAPNADAYSGFSGCGDCHHRSSCSNCHAQQDNGSIPGVGLPRIADFHEDEGLACVGCHSATPDPNDVDNDGDN